MLSNIKRLLAQIEVRENRGVITIEGIPSEQITRLIYQNWKTSKIADYMFNQRGRSKISLNSFFALELVYILNQLRANYRATITRRSLGVIIEQLYQNTWLRKTRQEPEEILDRRALRYFDKKPLDHQSEFFERYEELTQRYQLDGFMLPSPAGSGKTLTSLMLAEMLHSDRIIIVCLKNAIPDPWIQSLEEKEYRQPQTDYWASTQSGIPPRDKRFYICHFEAQDRMLEIAEEFANERVTLILDESHYMNEISAARTQNFIKLAQRTRAQCTLWVSGTPLKAIGAEMIPFLSSIDRRFSSDTQERFKKIFGISSERASDILSHRLGISSHRIEKSRIVKGEPIHETITASFKGAERYTLESVKDAMEAFIEKQMAYYKEHRAYYRDIFDQGLELHEEQINDQAQRKRYREYLRGVDQLSKLKSYRMAGDLMEQVNRYERGELIPSLPSDYRRRFRDASSVIKYTPLKVQGECLGQVLGKRRQEMTSAMIPHLGLPDLIDIQQKKSLVFTQHVPVVKQAGDYLQQHGYQPLLVHGETTKDLDSMIKSFSRDPKINPVVATYNSLSTAVPLTMASAVFLLNQPYRDYVRNQTISRVHRLGQDAQVYVYHASLDTGDTPNLSSRSFDIVEWSREQVNRLMGIEAPDEASLESLDINLSHSYAQPASMRW